MAGLARAQDGAAEAAIERASTAFRARDYADAAHWLRRAIRLAPNDEYVLEFLGTVYFIEGNLDAALQYWNRIGKPRLDGVSLPSGLRTDPVQLDRAFAFSVGAPLSLDALRTTRARVAAMGAFSNPRIELNARDDGTYEAAFLGREKNGLGATKWEAAISLLRGLPYQAIQPEYSNIGGRTTNVNSFLRWDPQKRRAQLALSGAWRGEARRRYFLRADARDEQWELQPETQPGTPIPRFALTRAAAEAGIASVYGNWDWTAAAEVSHRSFARAGGLRHGYQLKQTATVTRALVRLPEYRFATAVEAQSSVGRLFGSDGDLFGRAQAALTARWLPGMKGDDYAMEAHARAGAIAGQAPFDELFILGLERDNDLPLRAHIGTRDGRKGSAPLGRRYLAANWEIDKNVYGNGLVTLKLSPFLDVGKIGGFSSSNWLTDTGMQAKIGVVGFNFTAVYGKDLRTGRNSFYFLASR